MENEANPKADRGKQDFSVDGKKREMGRERERGREGGERFHVYFFFYINLPLFMKV